MPDLHGWISGKVAATEQAARTCPPSPLPVETGNGDYAATEIRDATGQVRATGLFVTPAAVLRRCAADRIILEIHQQEHGGTACVGCGIWGDCNDWETSNIDDCPTLLAIALALGLTDEQRRQLDRPQPPQPATGWASGRQADTSRVPAALRGPNWKGRP